MLHTIVSQPNATIDLTQCQAVAALIKLADLSNESLHRALDNAIEDMRRGRSHELHGNQLRCQSSHDDWTFYDLTIDSCPCDAQRGVCRHRARLAILLTLQTAQAAATACVPLLPLPGAPKRRVATVRSTYVPQHRTPMTDAEYARACALANDLC